MAQHALRCGTELAQQRGLPIGPPHTARQQPQQHDRPCTPTAEPLQRDGPDQHASSSTAVAQLQDSRRQHADDPSPLNNMVRRLAADIQTGDASTLQDTLQHFSSKAHRNRNSVSTNSSRGSSQSGDDPRPAASPGGSWRRFDAARLGLCPAQPQELEFDLQREEDSSSCTDAGASAAAMAAAEPAAISQLAEPLVAVGSLPLPLEWDSPASVRSAAEMHLADDAAAAALQPQHHSNLVPGRMPSIPFKGFSTAADACAHDHHQQSQQQPDEHQQDEQLAPTGSSMQLCTPRLVNSDPRRASHTSHGSSSNGTVASGGDEFFFSTSGSGSNGGACVQDATGHGRSAQEQQAPDSPTANGGSSNSGTTVASTDEFFFSMPGSDSSTASGGAGGAVQETTEFDFSSMQEQAATDRTTANEPACAQQHAAGMNVQVAGVFSLIQSASGTEGAGTEGAGTATAGGVEALFGSKSVSTSVSTTAAAQDVQAVAAVQAVDSTSSSPTLGPQPEVDCQQEPGEDADDEGYVSCDESDEEEQQGAGCEEAAAAGGWVGSTAGQKNSLPCTPAVTATEATEAASVCIDGEPCAGMQLSPLLLKQLSKQLSFQERGSDTAADYFDAGKPQDDDAATVVTCCETVYEECE